MENIFLIVEQLERQIENDMVLISQLMNAEDLTLEEHYVLAVALNYLEYQIEYQMGGLILVGAYLLVTTARERY